ncbi:MAG: prepilin-type N-terminal cleavage/methylation domain-containing protein [Pirellulaceae bacterium]|jgi:prepilin-type N-terminal cleavage/methylation domain-containing protein|nr:prepilin-type N-terminal cleavage/methylation domain-containing protein [Pirellulaceae bacterium]MDP6557901.1 prepilin-type N-terminal cleavage/methylation domain-containing protein [Pirellulaceae bacterium]MDP6722767.1 prepilin-type N-terminal cleavage/methylation domain-containing protein [Pirellulaceae bacterium]
MCNRSESRHCRRGFKAQRGGFTLLELLLALTLTGMVLYAIGVAVDLNLRAFQKRRSSIEQSQLARTLLRIIADDIRSSVAYYEQDLSGVEKLLTDTAESAASGALDELGLEVDPEALDTMLEDESTNTTELAAGETIPTKPGIYGNQLELQIDVSRLPRIEEYQQLLAVDPNVALMDLPSDVKTVTYFIQDRGLVAEAEVAGPAPALGVSSEVNGLVRREMDRSVTQWALENGNVIGMQQNGDVIAPEVVGMELSYFDGYEWRIEWDSEAEGSLPVAIQIILAMTPPTDPTTMDDPAVIDESTLNYYRSVIRIPTGRPVEEEEESLETDPLTEEGEGV